MLQKMSVTVVCIVCIPKSHETNCAIHIDSVDCGSCLVWMVGFLPQDHDNNTHTQHHVLGTEAIRWRTQRIYVCNASNVTFFLLIFKIQSIKCRFSLLGTAV